MEISVARLEPRSYRIVIDDDLNVLENIQASFQNYLTENSLSIEDDEFYIAEYIMYQDKIDIEDYYGAITNEDVTFDDALDYAGILTSFGIEDGKLVLTIEDAQGGYDEQMVEDFFVKI